MLRGICKWSASNVHWCLLKCDANKCQLKCPIHFLFFTILPFGMPTYTHLQNSDTTTITVFPVIVSIRPINKHNVIKDCYSH
jgi:hypothetical protein